MSNTARKLRKRLGIRFERTPKTGTPLADRVVPWATRKKAGELVYLPGANAVRRLKERAAVTGEAL